MTSHKGAAITLDDAAFTYEDMRMLFDVTIEAGGVTSVMGASGAGKSTFLNLVAGFETPDSGRVLIGGTDVTDMPPSLRPVSMVFQENNLFAHLTVEQNVGLGRSPALRLTEADRADIADALARTGLAGKEKRLPRELSGGERQRRALARVAVRDPAGAAAGRAFRLARAGSARGYGRPRHGRACRTRHDCGFRDTPAGGCPPNRRKSAVSGRWQGGCRGKNGHIFRQGWP